MFNTPILFLVFNRLDTTKQVFAKIREIQPRQLFIGADGAREGKEGEKEKVDAVRKYILENIDWDCEVKTLFREKNLGCGVAPAEAITWFFDNVEQGIILEDDCLPDLSFFGFCEELLNYYKDEERVMHIGGSNFQFGKKRGYASYYFSNQIHAWGWATWSSAWKYYDFNLKKLDSQKIEKIFESLYFSKKEKKFWLETYITVENGKRKDIWDFQWTFSIWLNNGIAIIPNLNLVSNIGFHNDATHTTYEKSKLSNIETYYIQNIIHEKNIKVNLLADKYTFNSYVPPKRKLSQKIRSILSKLLRKINNFFKYNT